MVTGGAGFIGTNLIKRLLKDGHNVVSLDNYSTGNKENEQKGCKYHACDIRDVLNFDYFMEEPDVIYHLAALPRIQPSFDFPAMTFEINALATMNLLEWAKNKNCKVVYAGSSSIHNGKYENPYSFSKDVAEQICYMYKELFDVNMSICRFYNVYGDYQLTDGEYAAVVGIFLEQFKKGKPLTITGDGLQRRDFTHVDDIVEGMILISETDWELVELGSGKNYSINELAEMFNHETTYIDERPGEARETLCDLTITQERIKYDPKGNLEKYVKGEISE